MILILIIGLLFALGGIIFLAWLFVLFPPSMPKSKYRSQSFKQSPLPPKSTKSSDISSQNFVRQSPAPTQKTFLAKNFKKPGRQSPEPTQKTFLAKNFKKPGRQSSVPTQKAFLAKNFKKQLLPSPARTLRVRLPKNLKKHLNNIEYASQVLLELRSITQLAKLPVVIATLRRISPYVFEELVLTCCFEQGWQIQRNFRYTGDGGIDGRVLILGKLYVIQVKRYADYISPEHIKDFLSCIESERASGGFFVHTGITGQLSKQLIRRSDKIILVSGQKLVNFVLGKQLKIIGITIPVKSVNNYQ
ncbi:restriction endonuclease (plasmid) [Nostoc sp. C057]|uniref:restriction endonuclease n=1 Tax=Nostoc sp. C057 TaxID=2576903 RepID=UPI0015C3AB04|nr:restriction endonuclease [Nostoc sp. C057]QLE52660.1 restriction endonuclease [Nostoc sp. C057]